jgi:hypothetical protein
MRQLTSSATPWTESEPTAVRSLSTLRPNTVVNHRWGRGDLMAGYTPPADVVQEMRALTTTFDAGIGHTQGGVTSVTLKSGTNQLHGTFGGTKRSSVLRRTLSHCRNFGKAPTAGRMLTNLPSAGMLSWLSTGFTSETAGCGPRK